ncbi:MAG: hypothetical protein GWP19_02450 [Planctomycetia bacterium]|nr:hypothetical protein [Planctomycetia bacterium]
MQEQSDPRQIALFPELSKHATIPSITTLPAFDKALNNLIKISDMGAFIELTISGLERLYTINIQELDIPADFIKNDIPTIPFSTHLFPADFRNDLKKKSYEVKSFFTSRNSFRTSFGYFLYRSHFTMWKHYLEKMNKSIKKTLYSELGHGKYVDYFLTHFNEGYDYLKSIASVVVPWEFDDEIDIKKIQLKRREILNEQLTISSLKPTEISYPFDLLIYKTNHIPISLKDYVENIQISSIFKSIHLEYLSDKKIANIDDIKQLVKNV